MRGRNSRNAPMSKDGNPKPKSVQSRLNVQNTYQAASSQISLNGSEVEETTPTFYSMVPLDQFIKKEQQTEEEKLVSLTDALNLPSPIYKIFPSAEGCIYAQVTIGDKKYTSFPDYARSKRAAKLIAINKALTDLEKEHVEKKPVELPITARDEQLIKTNILKIVDAHPHGVFTAQFFKYYEREFQESLPINWMKIVNECPELSFIYGANNVTILTRRYTPPSKVQDETPLQSSLSKLGLNPLVCPVPGKLEKLKVSCRMIYVSSVVNTSEIWCRLVGVDYSDQLGMMKKEMNEFYNKNSESMKATSIDKGVYYSILSDDCWLRVKCLEYDAKTEEASVFFIDHGSEETCDSKLLHKLDKQFCKLPGQALRLSLYGLEVFADFEVAMHIVEERLLNRTLYVDVQNYDSKEDCTSVIFYDTEGTDDINLNKFISRDLIEIIMPKPDIRKLDCPLALAYVSHVTKSGDVYLQLVNDNMQILINLLNEVIVNKLSGDFTPLAVSRVNHLKLYMVKSHEDGNWYRTSVKKINYMSNEVDAFLIDFGKTITANVSSLVELETISEILAQIPGQAVKVHLDNVPLSSFNEEKAIRLGEIAPPQLRILATIVNRNDINTSTPVVVLFLREKSSDELVPINNILVNDKDYDDILNF